MNHDHDYGVPAGNMADMGVGWQSFDNPIYDANTLVQGFSNMEISDPVVATTNIASPFGDIQSCELMDLPTPDSDFLRMIDQE